MINKEIINYDKFSVIIPCYNEEKNISKLVTDIQIALKKYKYDIHIVDDCSTDNLEKKVFELKKKYKNINYIRNNSNLGQSYSIMRGIKNSRNSHIVTIDGDYQNDPFDLPSIIEIYFDNKNFELVGGIRKKRKDSLVKIISSKIANYIRRKILNDNCLDTGCSLKIFNKNIFLQFPFFDGIHRFLPALYLGFGKQTFFINVNHFPRLYGLSKYGTFLRLIRGIRDIIKVRKIINEFKND